MPQFITTENIFKNFEEYFDPNWMDSDVIIYPETKEWDYSRELNIEDVDLWEVISGGFNNYSIFASWSPYAEFYMAVKLDPPHIETFYGKGATKKVINFMKKNNIYFNEKKIWVENDKMWLYDD